MGLFLSVGFRFGLVFGWLWVVVVEVVRAWSLIWLHLVASAVAVLILLWWLGHIVLVVSETLVGVVKDLLVLWVLNSREAIWLLSYNEVIILIDNIPECVFFPFLYSVGQVAVFIYPRAGLFFYVADTLFIPVLLNHVWLISIVMRVVVLHVWVLGCVALVSYEAAVAHFS